MLTRGLSHIECHYNCDEKQDVEYSCPRNDRRYQSERTQTATNLLRRVYGVPLRNVVRPREMSSLLGREMVLLIIVTRPQAGNGGDGGDGAHLTVKMSYLRARRAIVGI
jgi:hypothetical protein